MVCKPSGSRGGQTVQTSLESICLILEINIMNVRKNLIPVVAGLLISPAMMAADLDGPTTDRIVVTSISVSRQRPEWLMVAPWESH